MRNPRKTIVSALSIFLVGFGACASAPATDAQPTAQDGGANPPNTSRTDGATTAPDLMPPPLSPTDDTVVISGVGAFPREKNAYGQNYWSWVPAWGDPVAKTQEAAKSLRLNVLRAGGANNDNQSPATFDNSQVDEFIAFARAVGAEPILQVSVIHSAPQTPATAQAAADLVRYCNVEKKYNITYWEVGNEPDLYTEQKFKPASFSASDYCTTFASYVDAMKAVDPTIKVMGPELSWKYQASGANDWVTPFLQGCGDKVDIVAVHRYPLAPTACSLEAALADATRFRALIVSLRGKMAAQNVADKPLAITEANITWDGEPAKSILAASPGTFFAGLWVADNLGVALEERLWTNAYWSLSEGWTLGFYSDSTASAPRPAVHAMKLITEHFGPTILKPKTVPANLSAYASRDDAAKKTIVLVINKKNGLSRLTLEFEGMATAPAPRKMDAPAYSLTLVEIPDEGTAMTGWQYTKAMADEGKGPQALP